MEFRTTRSPCPIYTAKVFFLVHHKYRIREMSKLQVIIFIFTCQNTCHLAIQTIYNTTDLKISVVHTHKGKHVRTYTINMNLPRFSDD